MSKFLSPALLIIGIILLAMGWNAYSSVTSDVSRVFTGEPTDRAMGLLIAGGFSTLAGLGGLSRFLR